MRLKRHTVVLPAQAVSDREVGANLPFILRENAQFPLPEVQLIIDQADAIFGEVLGLRLAVDQSEQTINRVLQINRIHAGVQSLEGRDRKTGLAEHVESEGGTGTEIGVEVGVDTAVLSSELHSVGADHFGQSVPILVGSGSAVLAVGVSETSAAKGGKSRQIEVSPAAHAVGVAKAVEHAGTIAAKKQIGAVGTGAQLVDQCRAGIGSQRQSEPLGALEGIYGSQAARQEIAVKCVGIVEPVKDIPPREIIAFRYLLVDLKGCIFIFLPRLAGKEQLTANAIAIGGVGRVNKIHSENFLYHWIQTNGSGVIGAPRSYVERLAGARGWIRVGENPRRKSRCRHG